MSHSYSTITIGKKLWFLSGSLLVAISLMCALSLWISRGLEKALADSDDIDIPTVKNIVSADMLHDGIRANAYHAIILAGSDQTPEGKAIKAESVAFAKNMQEYLANLVKLDLNENLRKEIQKLHDPVDAYIKAAGEIVDTALAGNAESARALLPAFQEKFLGLEKNLAGIEDSIMKDIEASQKEDDENIRKSDSIMMASAAIAVIFGLLFSWFVIRNLQVTLHDVIAKLSSESETVTVAAETLSNASESLAASNTEQASALQETAASVDEISAMVKKTSENSKILEKTTQESQESAHKGQQSITQMLTTIRTISESHAKIMSQVEDGNQKITEIAKVIGEIGNKTKVINDIVFQTKLLSFNASVEAARAGEHGKGFAVVAEEVGNLAQMSGNAAKEISDMLGASIAKVEGIVTDNKRKVEGLILDGKTKIEQGLQVAEQCGDSLGEIVKSSTDVGTLVTEITTAIQEQTQGIVEISKAIQLLDQSTHENSTTSQKTSQTSATLLGQSKSLGGIVNALETMVSGKRVARGQRASAAPVAPVVRNVAVLPTPRVELKKAPRMPTAKMASGSDVIPSEDDPRFQDV